MKVLKFGGTSVANHHNIKKSVSVIHNQNQKIAVVVSALGGVTDSLIEIINLAKSQNIEYSEKLTELKNRHFDILQNLVENDNDATFDFIKESFNNLESLLEGCFLLGELSAKSNDIILSYGELLSSKIIFGYLKQTDKKVSYKDSRELIQTDSNYGNASINFEISDYLIQYYFDKNQSDITILPGFIAQSAEGNTTTLGRGGSDYSASVIAAALHASQLEIWTDVSGMYTAHPKLVKQASPITKISFKEAMELSHFGAKVLYAPTIQPVMNKNIPVYIKNTFEPNADGTYISNNAISNQNPVKGISHIENVALLTLEGSGLVGNSGVSKRLFGALAKEKINVIFITQASSEHSICLGILENEAQKAKQAIDLEFQFEIKQLLIRSLCIEKEMSIIAIVGENMKSHQGLSGKMFSTLGKNNINIRAIAQGASERNISVVIAKKDIKKGLNCLHEKFFEDNTKQLNLFICGVGNVGGKFIEQIHQQKKYLKEQLKINIRVIALADSQKMHFDEGGISLENWKHTLENGEVSCIDQFISKIENYNLRNSVFVDNTANEIIASKYDQFLKQNVAVVTCNKIACSSKLENYKNLKILSAKYNAPFLFETNVGAGLPIIDTLKNLIASGDKVNKIQAVLSGSLNFIFNNFSNKNIFHDVVNQAKNEGYTEPDPKIDLSGVDVMRKILILIRESGYPMEIEDIENKSFLPDEASKAESVDAFFNALKEKEDYFQKIYDEAKQNESRLKYVASFENGKASVGLQHIDKNHPFYNLEGKDNIVMFYTNRYKEQPLLIKGAGAGADVTASGIFADVIRIGNN